MDFQQLSTLICVIFVLFSCAYLLLKRKYVIISLLLLFLVVALLPLFIYTQRGYYLKLGSYYFIMFSWLIFSIHSRLSQPPRMYKLPHFFGLCFVLVALISALLSVSFLEPAVRAISFLLLLSLGYVMMPSQDLAGRSKELLTAIVLFDLIILCGSLLGINNPNFYAGGRFGGIFTPLATSMALYAYSIAIVFLSFILFRKQKGLFRLAVNITIFLVSIAIIVMTGSRAGYFSCLVGLLSVFGIYSRGRLVLLSFLAILGLIFASVFITISMGDISTTILRGSTIQQIGGPRWSMAQQAFKVIEKHPFFGIGMGSVPGDDSAISSHIIGKSEGGRATGQNGYILLLAETGIFGLLFYGGWLVLSLYAGVNHIPENLRGYWAAFLGLFLAYAFHGIFEEFPSGPGNIVAIRMWAMAGLFTTLGHFKEQ